MLRNSETLNEFIVLCYVINYVENTVHFYEVSSLLDLKKK